MAWDNFLYTFPDFHFFPLAGFNREQLATKFLESKLYIDFGHHPGKDRLPREAGIHGCCVITGLYGSASNAFDVNIPPAYKIDSRLPDFFTLFEIQVNLIFNHFSLFDFSIWVGHATKHDKGD